MNASYTPKPILWMLADRPPARDGDTQQQRAWDLIDAARASHRVVLTLTTRHPVWLEQWRMIQDRVDVFDLQPIGLLSGLNQSHTVPPAIEGEAIDVVVATTPRLWMQARHIPCRTTVCDLVPYAQEHAHDTKRSRRAGITSLLKPLQRTKYAAAQAMIECDLALTESDATDAFAEHVRGGYADEGAPSLKLTPLSSDEPTQRRHAA